MWPRLRADVLRRVRAVPDDDVLAVDPLAVDPLAVDELRKVRTPL
jgi:hypothetical protein